MSEPLFRTARAEDLTLVLDWAAAEGWNPGLDDAEAFLAVDAQGFFVAEVEGRTVAAISVVNHSPEMAFLGLYLCLPEFRGRGIGYRLWQHALAHAGARTVGLDGVAAQEPNYAKSGFVRTGASLRMEGRLPAAADPAVRLAAPGDAAAIRALDAAANGYARPAFVAAWTTSTPTRHCVVLDRRAGAEGFAVIRRCQSGAKIGPVVAPDADAALLLAQAAVDLVPAGQVVIDVPSQNTALLAALRARGFAETFATARMYRGAPPSPGQGLQAIATMELG